MAKIKAKVKVYTVYFLALNEETNEYKIVGQISDGEYAGANTKASAYAKEKGFDKDVFRTTPRVEQFIKEIEM